MFIRRAVDTTPFQAQLQDFDIITREALNRILATPITDLQWAQAKLPVTMEGLGLRAVEDHGPAAYVFSILSSETLQSYILGKEAPAEVGVEQPSDGREPGEDAGEQGSAKLSLPLLNLLSNKLGEEDTTVEDLKSTTQKEISYRIDQNKK